MRRYYQASDEWLRGLSRGKYAAVLGAFGAAGVLAVGLLVSREVLLLQALTIALVLFGMEYAFGLYQSSEEE